MYLLSSIFHDAAISSALFPAFIAACTDARKSLLNCAYSARSAHVITVLWPVIT